MKNKTVDCKTIVLILAVGLFVIGVTHIGHTAPYFINEGDTATRSVDENAAVGTNVGAAFTIDKDGSKTVRYEFPDYNNKFEYIVGLNKKLCSDKN